VAISTATARPLAERTSLELTAGGLFREQGAEGVATWLHAGYTGSYRGQPSQPLEVVADRVFPAWVSRVGTRPKARLNSTAKTSTRRCSPKTSTRRCSPSRRCGRSRAWSTGCLNLAPPMRCKPI
jgi:hypothetical protein